MEKETTRITEELVRQINHVMDSISDVQNSEARDQPLKAMIANAIDLSRLLRVQRAVFNIITMPWMEDHQKMMFDTESMEDIGGEDEDALQEKEIILEILLRKQRSCVHLTEAVGALRIGE